MKRPETKIWKTVVRKLNSQKTTQRTVQSNTKQNKLSKLDQMWDRGTRKYWGLLSYPWHYAQKALPQNTNSCPARPPKKVLVLWTEQRWNRDLISLNPDTKANIMFSILNGEQQFKTPGSKALTKSLNRGGAIMEFSNSGDGADTWFLIPGGWVNRNPQTQVVGGNSKCFLMASRLSQH